MADRILPRLRLVARLGPWRWGDLLYATFELMLARLKLNHVSAISFFRPVPGDTCNLVETSLSPQQKRLIRRVAFAIPCMGARVPWRSDCLVQALAAQRWLGRAGILAKIDLGVRTIDGVEAHAWLIAGGRIVTGGDIGPFTPFITSHAARP